MSASHTREEQLPPEQTIAELAPNIRRLQLPMSMPGLGHVNCYILDDANGAALVDPGLPGPANWRALMAGLRRAELPPERVHTIVVTHSHPDHFGAAGRFHRQFGANVVTHQNFRLWWDRWEEDDDPLETASPEGTDPEEIRVSTHSRGPGAPTPWGGSGFKLPLGRRAMFAAMRRGWGGRFLATPTPTKRVDDADHIELAGRTFVAVHTPGHTADHLCLLDPEGGVMICGDHVLPTITPHISGIGSSPDPLRDFFGSLDRVAEFDGVSLALPAHGQPFTDLAGRVNDIKRHHHDRLDLLREASDRLGIAPVQDYMQQLFKERSWGPMAESETFAHLEHLRHAGEATVGRRNDGVLEYALR